MLKVKSGPFRLKYVGLNRGVWSRARKRVYGYESVARAVVNRD